MQPTVFIKKNIIIIIIIIIIQLSKWSRLFGFQLNAFCNSTNFINSPNSRFHGRMNASTGRNIDSFTSKEQKVLHRVGKHVTHALVWKRGSVGNTRLLPHAKMLLVPIFFFLFLWRVDYALEENVLTDQMWFLPLISDWEVVTRI